MSGSAGRRMGSLGRAELLLLWRNRTALANALLVPVAVVGVMWAAKVDRIGGLTGNAFLISGALGVALLLVVYYNLVGTYVARREELVLKRLRTGETTDPEILAGTAVPAVAIVVAQAVLLVAAGALFLGLPWPVNPPVLLLGVLGGIVVFVLLAAASSAVTRNVEMAQISTMPVILACTLGSGLALPLDTLPGPLAQVLHFLPLTPAVELIRLGWLGTTGADSPKDFVGVLGPAALRVEVLAVWAVLGTVAVRRWFRWEPRR